MKKNLIFFAILTLFLASCGQPTFDEKSWIRINQLGYQPDAKKVAVFISRGDDAPTKFTLCDSATSKEVKTFKSVTNTGAWSGFTQSVRLDFSELTEDGTYYIQAGNIKSPVFKINKNVYDGTADFLLKYMRQQRCGFNPYLNDHCHTGDGFIVYHPTLNGKHMDATGGWHDASDYLQYVATSANAVFQMLLAYKYHPEAFGDQYQANGRPGANGIPDILDEAKWGMDWLVKMNPEKDMMFNQLADDRDHRGYRLPTLDTVDYGKGPGKSRPVYYCTGEPQGLMGNMNRATGIASTAGKYASAFAFGSQLLKDYYPKYAEMIAQKAIDAYNYGVLNPGACQTAPCSSPYFYEEDNWVDDMELAAAQLALMTGDTNKYIAEAAEFGRQEPITPWMGADTARHYQWYPFMNAGHYLLAMADDRDVSEVFKANMKAGIDAVYNKGKNTPFLNGIPFIWCSNNLTTAMLTHIDLYKKATGDSSYDYMEAALRDWVFGCNPWGTSMVVGLPSWGDTPIDPHSAFTSVYSYPIDGGLVDGPVYSAIFNGLRGVYLKNGDAYEDVQPERMVYHDDNADYSTNEPTMDGTACLTYYLSAMEARGKR
ncbi:MAG: glycoside hydrolase family 9 protein [Prevotellaceae bacterium]|jgi:hypothetical protein|nr:glycoside hydrolase family 9 protein [Prevotellaceae bacterium]